MENINFENFDKAIDELVEQAKMLRLHNLEIQEMIRKMEEADDEYFNKLYGYMAVNNN